MNKVNLWTRVHKNKDGESYSLKCSVEMSFLPAIGNTFSYDYEDYIVREVKFEVVDTKLVSVDVYLVAEQ